MSDYLVTGKKGNGKSLVCVGLIRDALAKGLRVATNLDIFTEHLLPLSTRKIDLVRLPDRPSVADMEALGKGAPMLDEAKYGLIVLDEMATWMNARSWADKERQALLDWFVHSRKERWHTYFICQGIDQIDKQIRSSLMDHHVICRRLDKMRIPVLGSLSKAIFGVEIRPPKLHVAKVRFGMEHNAMVTDTWTYRGHALYKAYDTEQVFRDNYPHGMHSMLSPWHIEGYKHKFRRRPSEVVRDFFKPLRRNVSHKPKLPLVAALQALPPDERIAHWRRLNAGGAL